VNQWLTSHSIENVPVPMSHIDPGTVGPGSWTGNPEARAANGVRRQTEPFRQWHDQTSPLTAHLGLALIPVR